MPIVLLTKEAEAAVRAKADPVRFKSAGTQLPSGDWLIPLDQDTIEAVEGHRLEGETFSETVVRIMAISPGAGSPGLN